MRWSALVLVLALGFAHVAANVGAAHAQEAERAPRAMTLDQALAHARTSHPRIVAARARLESARVEGAVPAAQWRPRVGAMAQVIGSTVNNSSTTLLGTDAVDIPRIGATAIHREPHLQPYPSTALAIGARQQLFDFGRVQAESAAARLVADVERHRATGARLDVEVAVAEAFYAVLASRAVLEASEQARGRAAAHRDMALAGVESGLRSPIDLTRAEADVARFEVGVARAGGGLRVARTVFAVATGVPDDELEAAGNPPPLGMLRPLPELLERGSERDPVLLEAEARVHAQKATTTAIDAQTRPTVFATGAVSSRAGGAPSPNGPPLFGDGWLPVMPNWHVGVVLTWPVLEPTVSARAEASRALEHAAQTDAADLRRARRAVIASAYHEARAAEEAAAATERATAAARANYEHAEQRFRVGLGTATELADAEALRTDADIQLAIARFQASRTRALLARSIAEAP
jgi:outer membrane protein